MKELLDALSARDKKGLRFFHFLSEEEIITLSRYCERKDAKSGEVLINEGEKSEFLAFIISGRLEATKDTGFKGNDIVLAEYSQGSTFGELGLLDRRPSGVTIAAVEDSTLVILKHHKFESLAMEDSTLALKLLKGLLLTASIRLTKCYDRFVSVL